MKTIKTTISIQQPLFDQVEDMSKKRNVSPSRLFVIAMEEYIQRQRNRDLLDQINDAYTEEPDLFEQSLLNKSRKVHRMLIEGEW